MVRAQAIQAGLHRIHDVAPRSAAVIGAGSHLAEGLGGDDHVGALYAQVLERLAHQPFGQALGIDVGGVDEVDAAFEGLAHDGVDLLLVKVPDGGPDAAGRAAEGHGSKADFGDVEAATAQLTILHVRCGPLELREWKIDPSNGSDAGERYAWLSMVAAVARLIEVTEGQHRPPAQRGHFPADADGQFSRHRERHDRARTPWS